MCAKPKKRLGQNFLTCNNVRARLVSACQFSRQDIVLEIGAGRGEMTGLIAKEASKVYAVELDSALQDILKANLGPAQNVEIINRDILKIDLGEYFSQAKYKIKVFGNIPYYITTPILEHLLRYRDKISSIFITVQKEFAKRMAAAPGSKDYGSFSCYVQYYAQVTPLFFISRNSFSPSPKVDSCFLKIVIRDNPPVQIKDEQEFFKLIRTAFNQRRKILRNSLRETVPQEKLELFFSKYGIDKNTRPERLSLQNFADLANL